MRIEAVQKMTPLEVSAYWATEREEIRKKKSTGQNPPWTDDTILQSYRFCCPRRMDDKVSLWLMQNWYTRHTNHENMPFACVVARHFNQPHTLELLTNLIFSQKLMDHAQITLRYMETLIRDFKKENPKTSIFNAAYIISGGTGNGQRAGTGDKIAMLFSRVLGHFVTNPVEVDPSSMQTTHARVQSYYGMGSFMAGQVVADLRHAVTGTWADKDDWAPQGPGSTRGLLRVNGKEPNPKGLDSDQFAFYFAKYMQAMRRKLPRRLVNKMEAMDYQNCLCETDKYLRTLYGEATPKQKYPGSGK